ncbi:uncharacterized protein EKO05_0005875 [Ascochyta rabiei]|uniref:Uncharacterized protein n=1 Tax=Didymella rabiei TaxID=5454 RepID=A0A163J0H0_DIDRA|nr:uncharacterized protein EKO05_0005875 [Ascochyta rabiei]KZM26062.1 hypothetical protein ST47_g2816 [Ascochyta rabiei]UPX15428.1 hypothetical protein EKO05_0005875 [Ascochyta rabiei]
MQPHTLILLAAALRRASVLAAPVTVSADESAIVFTGKEMDKRQTGFRTAAYAHLYREAADAGLAEEKAEERSTAETEDAVLVDRDAEK